LTGRTTSWKENLITQSMKDASVQRFKEKECSEAEEGVDTAENQGAGSV